LTKAREYGETWAVDAELRDALNQLAEDLRGEIRSGDAETRAYIGEVVGASAAETRTYVDEVVGASAAETRAYIDEVVGASAAETRRHSGVIGESLRGEIRALAEAMAINNEGTQRRFSDEAGRTERLEGRVLRLEARVTNLEDDRKTPRQL
jgi:hypothetical protein